METVRLETWRLSLAMALVVMAGGCDSTTLGSRPAPVTIVLTSFVTEDNGVWGGETGPFLEALTGVEEITADLAFCRRAWQGSIQGQPVSAVAAGSGKVEVALCMEDLLRHYRGQSGIKEVIWSGIAGATPMVGGLVDDEGRRRAATAVAIGDVCISHLALDWDRQYQSVDQDPRWWSRPPKPNYSSVGDPDLVEELTRAAGKIVWPAVPRGAAETTDAYHGEGSSRSPRVHTWSTCGEVTADMFWHGLSEDRRARALLAELISEVLATEARAPHEVTAVSACNNAAWMNTLEMWAARTGDTIPFAFVRAMSNYTHPPLDQEGRPLMDAETSIRWSMSEGDGASYAATTAALPVLKMLELRATR